jgi:hypothetical protein
MVRVEAGLETVGEARVVEVKVVAGREEEAGRAGEGRVVGMGTGAGMVVAYRREWLWTG